MSVLLDALQLLLNKEVQAGNLNGVLQHNIRETCAKLSFQSEDILQLVEDVQYYNKNDDSVTWKFISLALHILLSIRKDLEISVAQTNLIKTCFKFIITLGLVPNLLPGIGVGIVSKQSAEVKELNESLSIIEQYYRLAGTTKGLILCTKSPVLRHLFMECHLSDLMASLIQLSNAPLKKPAESEILSAFNTNVYEQILKDRNTFNLEFVTLIEKSHKPVIMRELMIFYGNKSDPPSPAWLKRSVFQILNCKLQESKGVESIVQAMTDFNNYDTGVAWKQLNIIIKLLMNKPPTVDEDSYYKNICGQVLQLLEKRTSNEKCVPQFEMVVCLSIKYCFEYNNKMCIKYLIPKLFEPLEFYSSVNSDHIKSDMNVTTTLVQNLRILHSCFTPSAASDSCLSSELLTRFLKILFCIYVSLFKSSFATSKVHLQDITVRCLNECKLSKNRNKMFQALLFDIHVTETLEMRKDLQICIISDEIILKPTEHRTIISKELACTCFAEMLELDVAEILSLNMFGFLLEALAANDAKAEKGANKELLDLEDSLVLDQKTERKLVILKLLSTLVENLKIQKHLAKQPNELFTFIENVLDISITNKVYEQEDCETSEFQTLFVTVMILQATVHNSEKIDLQKFPIMCKHLSTIETNCKNPELKALAGMIINNKDNGHVVNHQVQTEVDKAIEDICDPLLPVRAHGLMTLTKLLENKDADAILRKQYLLNIFQQNLKNDDSYIYLSAIGGLAAMCNIFTDTVLTTLCDEYSELANRSNNENNDEVRMKVGEVLVRVVKSLGELAPKYKSLLLNTFLLGCKDDDHLIRASSLSNLGEICRVLGYKLGTIVSEVLVCTHAIITTDKAVEARRAAVTVIRQLFVGLDSEMIAFLKEDVLPIYRTLKNVYNNDPDDIMKLQAQLALEQLNENMKEFVFPKLSVEKRVVMPN